jgi:ABC-type long-subunit fatty acid transport system fused permease/ATPase subunit
MEVSVVFLMYRHPFVPLIFECVVDTPDFNIQHFPYPRFHFFSIAIARIPVGEFGNIKSIAHYCGVLVK